MLNKPNVSLAGFVVLSSLAGLLLYHFWIYVVAFLAMCGAYYLLEQHRRQ